MTRDLRKVDPASIHGRNQLMAFPDEHIVHAHAEPTVPVTPQLLAQTAYALLVTDGETRGWTDPNEEVQ